MRRFAVLVVAVAALFSWSGAAAAHATVDLTVHSDGRGSVSVDVAWSDGHPVTEPIAATMTAVGAGTTIGPVALERLPGQPTAVYGGTLPRGQWRVIVDTALPGIGHCEAVVPVGDGRPSSTRCGSSAPASAAAEPEREAGETATARIAGAVVLALAALVLAVAVVYRRRARR